MWEGRRCRVSECDSDGCHSRSTLGKAMMFVNGVESEHDGFHGLLQVGDETCRLLYREPVKEDDSRGWRDLAPKRALFSSAGL